MRNSLFVRVVALVVSTTVTATIFQAVALIGHPEEAASWNRPDSPALAHARIGERASPAVPTSGDRPDFGEGPLDGTAWAS